MDVKAPIQKHSVRSSNRDNSAFIKKKVYDYLNIPTAPKTVYTGNLKKKRKKKLFFNKYYIITSRKLK